MSCSFIHVSVTDKDHVLIVFIVLVCSKQKLIDTFQKFLFQQLTASVNASDRFDVSALHMAADEGHVDCVAMLLENDAMCNNGTKYSKHGSYTGIN